MAGWRLVSGSGLGLEAPWGRIMGDGHRRFPGKLVSMATSQAYSAHPLSWRRSLTNGHWMPMGGSRRLLATMGSEQVTPVLGTLCPNLSTWILLSCLPAEATVVMVISPGFRELSTPGHGYGTQGSDSLTEKIPGATARLPRKTSCGLRQGLCLNVSQVTCMC